MRTDEHSVASSEKQLPKPGLQFPQDHGCERFLLLPEGSTTAQSSSVINVTWRPSVYQTAPLLSSLPSPVSAHVSRQHGP